MAGPNDPFFSNLDNQLMGTLSDLLLKTVEHLAGALHSPITAACTLYIAFMGYNIMYGRSSIPMWDFIATAFKLSIVIALATNVSRYNNWITNIFFHNLPNAIANVTQGAHSDINVWDNMMKSAYKHALQANSKTAWYDVATYIVNWFAGLICIVIAGFFCTIGFIVTTFAKLGSFLVLSVGPLFISLGLFSTTRRFTEAWLGQLANFIILQVLVVLLGNVYISLALKILSNSPTDIMFAVVQFLVIGIGGIYLFIHLPGIASALAAGGASLTSSTHLAHHSSRLAGQGTLAVGRGGWRGLKNLASKFRGG